MATKTERRAAEHLAELRRRVRRLERSRPGERETIDLAGSLADVERRTLARAAFAKRNGVVRYKNSARNVAMILRSGGASPDAVRYVQDSIGRWGALDGPFDHGEIFGKGGRPAIIVGHPYDISRADLDVLWNIARLGLDVRTDGESFYGHGTFQVLVRTREGGGHPGPTPGVVLGEAVRKALGKESN